MESSWRTRGGLSDREVAEILGFSVLKVKRMRYNGELRFAKIGKSVRIPPSEVDRLMVEGLG